MSATGRYSTGGTNKKRKQQPLAPFQNGTKSNLRLYERKKHDQFGRRVEQDRRDVVFGLDTNVLMTDATTIFKFEEHNIFLPFQVLMELDRGKKGTSERAVQARQAIDFLVQLIESVPKEKIKQGIPLIPPGEKKERKKYGKLFFDVPEKSKVKELLSADNPDHTILLECLKFKENTGSNQRFILVSKDKVMRIISLLIGLPTEDHFDDAINLSNLRTTGVHELPAKFWEKQKDLECDFLEQNVSRYKLKGKALEVASVNEFLSIQKNAEEPETVDLRITEKPSPQIVIAQNVIDYTKRSIFGIKARNREQSFALNALLDPDIHIVIIEGPAGCGKNFLTLAAAYYQILEKSRYESIVATRDAVPVGKELGYKPGTETQKMLSWMGGMTDNVKRLAMLHKKKIGEDASVKFGDFVDYLEILELNSMRGRSLHDTFLIFDENQNSNRAQQRLILTRAAVNTKIVCLGNFRQADTLLTSRTSGLARVIAVSRGWKRAAHIVMHKGERSEVASYYEKYL